MYLKYKNEIVATVKMMGKTPIGYKNIYNKDLLPIGTITYNEQIPLQETQFFKEWLKSRSIPNLRQNLDKIIHKLGILPEDGFLSSLGVSLTDSYWFCPEDCDLKWEDVNFYDNGFECTFAKAIFDSHDSYSYISPDFTTDGVMEKFWYLSGNTAFLAKIDNLYHNLLLANEIVYYQIAQKAGIITTPYYFRQIDNKYTVDCPNFAKKDYDYVNAMQLKHSNIQRTIGTGLSDYMDKDLNLKKELDNIRFLDSLLHQEDRHEKNIGIFIKDHDLSTAILVPSFDNGSCLGFSRKKDIKTSMDDLKFFKKSRQQVMYDVNNLPLLNKDEIFQILENTYHEFHIPKENLIIAKEELELGFIIYEQALQKQKQRENKIEEMDIDLDSI